MWSHHNIVKFLIGITPQGSVAFTSQGWGGRTSNVHITENCGLHQKLLPGDLVLANRVKKQLDSTVHKLKFLLLPEERSN